MKYNKPFVYLLDTPRETIKISPTYWGTVVYELVSYAPTEILHKIEYDEIALYYMDIMEGHEI